MDRQNRGVAMAAEIEVIVSSNGTVTIEVKGQQGSGCVDLTRALEDALGSVESRECKVEYFESVGEGERLRQREG